MKLCSVKPYKGQENYIFISYCHRDRAYVFPIIEQMARDGYRIWFDDGITPGLEWPEVVGKYLKDSTVCLAFITANSLNSDDCRREINYALRKKKCLVSIALEEAEMSPGMEMQLTSVQSVLKYVFSKDEDFFARLYETEELEKCKGAPDDSIEVSSPEDYEDDKNCFVGIRQNFNSGRSDWFRKQINSADADIKRSTEENAKVQVPIGWSHFLEREKTGELIKITKSPFKVGRSTVTDDYVITDNQLISRSHAMLMIRDDICRITDNRSKNKTFVNGKAIVPGVELTLSDGDNVKLYNENFVYMKRKK